MQNNAPNDASPASSPSSSASTPSPEAGSGPAQAQHHTPQPTVTGIPVGALATLDMQSLLALIQRTDDALLTPLGNSPRDEDDLLPDNGNRSMIGHLKRRGVLADARVEKAFRAVPRGEFVPRDHATEAYVNLPLRVTAMEFTISAPEVYASALEALNIQPGHRFLDVGSGCGLLTAMGAYLAGPTGFALGIDLTPEIVELARHNVGALLQPSTPPSPASHPAQDATPTFATGVPHTGVHFALCNAFLLDVDEWAHPHGADGRFDRIHCGATCPESRLHDMIGLLRPGGVLVTPCGSAMLALTRAEDEASLDVSKRIVSSVRYGDLVIPSERLVLQYKYKQGMHKRARLLRPAGTTREDTPTDKRAENLYLSAQGSDVTIAVQLEDGSAREIPAHKRVLAKSSGHFRALFGSGMRDADTERVELPPEFDEGPFLEVLRFMYTGTAEVSSETCVAALEIGKYYDLPDEFYYICEECILYELTPENAADVLQFTARYACQPLKACVCNYILQHYDVVVASRGWKNLDAALVGDVLYHSVQANKLQTSLIESPMFTIDS